jgi:hypothetical protein
MRGSGWLRSTRPLLLGAALAACGARESDPRKQPRIVASSRSDREQAEITTTLASLRDEESKLRADTDFATLPPSSRSFGANPYALVALPGGRFAGVLRGDSRIVLLDTTLAEVASAVTSPSPSALALGPDQQAFVASPLEHAVQRFRLAPERIDFTGALAVPHGAVLRALAADERSLVAADFDGDRLLTWPMKEASGARVAAAVPSDVPACGGPVRLALSPRYVAVACLFEHAVWLLERGDDGAAGRVAARIVHDGPLWSVALLELGNTLFVAAGGAEDHPLERKDRVFGYVDSFVFLYSLGAGDVLTRLAATNVSAMGLVTPKAVALEAREGAPVTTALGYGSDTALELPLGKPPRALASVPGCAALVVTAGRRICANPLLDAWVELGPAPRVHSARAATPQDPSRLERLGEALFFTTLMAPDASSEGRLSRFTCETCHFEGGTDGRVHHSGRDDIRVSTRPLFGLFNDAPHFSRAHDRDLTSVCHNEFAVANRGNPIDPWFSLAPARFPWLRELGFGAGTLSPLELRRALLRFLARFSPEENPFVSARSEPRHFDAAERRGAVTFRERCERCHEARLVAREPASRVRFERWEELTLASSTPIVWARGEYEKTGVVPYVDAQGTRVPSLRRLYLKRPYLTNGSARTLESLLAEARVSATAFEHQSLAKSTELVPLAADERADLLAFLRLL